jgi:hypothetical protein
LIQKRPAARLRYLTAGPIAISMPAGSAGVMVIFPQTLGGVARMTWSKSCDCSFAAATSSQVTFTSPFVSSISIFVTGVRVITLNRPISCIITARRSLPSAQRKSSVVVQ